ncbi:hypothetical protein [Desulfitobacterium hafniense]|nr:hypothetical protein [Desulfitobacterium hafniense]
MMNRKHSIVLIILGIFLITFIVMGCGSDKIMEPVQSTKNFPTDGLTLLERAYEDIDSDGDKESVEVYTSAQIAPDGQMGWDTGERWVLLVRNGEEAFPLFDDSVQYGELQFWIASINKDQIVGPKSTDLQRKIYAAVTTDIGFKLLKYHWDEQNLCYKREVILNPTDQWSMRHSNKYNIPDPARIESNGRL